MLKYHIKTFEEYIELCLYIDVLTSFDYSNVDATMLNRNRYLVQKLYVLKNSYVSSKSNVELYELRSQYPRYESTIDDMITIKNCGSDCELDRKTPTSFEEL